jgi:hypothetical protein
LIHWVRAVLFSGPLSVLITTVCGR